MKQAATLNTCEFHVHGMHCAACELLLEKKLSSHQHVIKVEAVLAETKVTLHLGDDIDIASLREELNELIGPHGYTLHHEAPAQERKWGEVVKALGIASVVVGAFLLLQKLGIVNLVNTDQLSLPLIFLIGIIASLSTCMAVVGGLVLSISGNYAKGRKFRPLAFFHISRLVSFFLLGGLIGILGSAFLLTPTISFIINLILFGVMVILGVNLLDLFPHLKRFQLKMPKFMGKNALALERRQSRFTPILLGAVTFFLPCGFTQSMQLYSLTTGNFLTGALTMLVFAIGTLPVLALISFASIKFSQTIQSGLFYKTAGFIVLFFALFNFVTALVAIGAIPPFINL